jgi:hypothetical protein
MPSYGYREMEAIHGLDFPHLSVLESGAGRKHAQILGGDDTMFS